ncbi:MAG: M4 family metallopeptidase [Acidobacteria bacterium]|nr:M4 family metallopeptidase [Acidobacteriota bacterium]
MALERQPAATGAELVKYSGAQHNVTFTTSLVGQGIASVGSVPMQVHDGEMVWKLIRQETDDLGMTHSFYRQVLVPSAALAAGLEPAYLRDGLELAGSEVGIHLRTDGSLRAVFGTQYRDAVVPVLPTITTAAQAFAVGLPALATRDGLIVRDYPAWAARMTASGRASLLLASAGDGRTFRPTWQLEVSDDDGIPYVAALDAVTGEVVSVVRAVLDGTCNPSTTIQASATGEPQNQAIPNRSIKATLANDRLPTFTHEASWPGDGVTYPDIQVFFSIKENDPGFSTYMCPSKWHGILPVKTVSGTVTYDNWTEEAFLPGRAAADAIKFTRDTMYVLKSKLGRFSWDGSGGEAKVVLNSWVCGGPDFPCFMVPETAWNPPNSVNLGPNGSRPYLYSSCLDMVAHEWGHGVIFTTAKFDRNDPVGAQLHEGFADFIGYATEWHRQPAGSGSEQAEWRMGEDNGAAARWVDSDDGDGGLSFHADDPASANQEPHGSGNRIGVAFRLLDVGGRNDVCNRPPQNSFSGCSTTVGALGLTKSSRILFRTLTQYAYSTAGWNDLVELGLMAAFDLYSACGKCGEALTEQQSTYDAFKAIGHTPHPFVPEGCPSCP